MAPGASPSCVPRPFRGTPAPGGGAAGCSRPHAGGVCGGHRQERRAPDRERSYSGVRLRSHHRGCLPGFRLRAHRAGGGRGVRGAGGGGAREPRGLQVGTSGEARPPRRQRRVRDPRGGGARRTSARSWRPRGGRRGDRPRGGKDEEERRAGSWPSARSTTSTRPWRADAPEVDHAEGLQVLPGPHEARLRPRRVGYRGPERLGQVEHHRRRAVGDRRAERPGGRAARRCRT